jgi:hypothetical protein
MMHVDRLVYSRGSHAALVPKEGACCGRRLRLRRQFRVVPAFSG